MSHQPWRALRALRIILACLVLWLPARSAAASLGPVDTVVMIAGAAGATSTAKVSAPAASGDDRSVRDAAARSRASAATTDLDFIAGQACRADRAATASRSVVARRYLHCCVFLR